MTILSRENFFFFQSEDGIRDPSVTGVQTCALPILGPASSAYGQDFSESARRSDFKAFCQDFQDNYAFIDRPERPWKTWNVRYARAVDAADTREEIGRASCRERTEISVGAASSNDNI